MIPVVSIFAGLAVFVLGAVLLRSFGDGYRIGRLLSATPAVSVAEAATLARSGGPSPYVKVSGRIDAETDFEDDAHRPLVFRRTRIELLSGKRWRLVDDRREAVPFQINEGLDRLAIRHADLDAGLVVLPRESTGVAAEVPDHVPPETGPATPVRLRVQQVSSVEHAIVVGVPSVDAYGTATLGAGPTQPLILTTLEIDEAMRILAGDHPRRPMAVAMCLVVGLILVCGGLIWSIAGALL